MFTQGQVLGMKTDMMQQIKDEIKMGDRVAAKHPYSAANAPGGRIAPRETPAQFVTAYGSDVSATSRVKDRNAGAREVERALKWDMTEPFPRGYAGHVPGIRSTVGSTYGKQTRYDVNRVSHGVEEPRKGQLVSTYNAAFTTPGEQIAARRTDAAASKSVERTTQALVSTAHAGYKQPPMSVYQAPAWTERATSNIGQPDNYKHFKESTIHMPGETILKTLRPLQEAPITTTGPRPRVAQTAAPAAGVASRPDAFLLSSRR